MTQNDTLKIILSQGGTRETAVPALAMSRHRNGARKSIWKRGPQSFGFCNNPKSGFFFILVVLAANIILATLAWVIVGWVTG